MIESLDIFHVLIFTIPGFFLVWSYTRSRKTKIGSDFEYLMFSFFWGLCVLGLWGFVLPEEKFNLFFNNIYAGTVSLSIVNIILGFGLGAALGGKFDKYIDRAFIFIRNKFKS